MKCEHYYYNCSKEFIYSINKSLAKEVIMIIGKLPKRSTQAEINQDLFWLFTLNGWLYDTVPNGTVKLPPRDLDIELVDLEQLKKRNNRSTCITSTTVNASWRCDYAKLFGDKLVQIEVQFGKVESMFKDFCGFKIADHERRLALGIEVVMSEPNKYFSHRKSAMGGMAYFEIAKTTLPSIGLNCPIWLIGIRE